MSGEWVSTELWDTVSYDLNTRVRYERRPKASTLFIAMARQILRLEEQGKTVEFFQGYLSEDGDYLAIYCVGGAVASSDDLHVADEALNNQAEQQAAKQREIELAKQLDRYRLQKLRENGQGNKG